MANLLAYGTLLLFAFGMAYSEYTITGDPRWISILTVFSCFSFVFYSLFAVFEGMFRGGYDEIIEEDEENPDE